MAQVFTGADIGKRVCAWSSVHGWQHGKIQTLFRISRGAGLTLDISLNPNGYSNDDAGFGLDHAPYLERESEELESVQPVARLKTGGCECGAWIGHNKFHSDWCPLYVAVNDPKIAYTATGSFWEDV